MAQLFKRLKSKSGESLIESLAGILIFTLASITMLTMVTTGSNINAAAKKADEQYYEDMVLIERAAPTDATDLVLNFSATTDTTNYEGSVTVDSYRNGNGLYAFYPEGGAGA